MDLDLLGGGWVEIKIRVHVSSRNIKDQVDTVTRSMQRSSSGLKQLWALSWEPSILFCVCQDQTWSLAVPPKLHVSQCARIWTCQTIRPCVAPTCQTDEVSEVICSCMDKLFLKLKIPLHYSIAPQNSITTFHIPFLMLRDRLYIIYIRGGWGSFLTSLNIVRSLFLQPV